MQVLGLKPFHPWPTGARELLSDLLPLAMECEGEGAWRALLGEAQQAGLASVAGRGRQREEEVVAEWLRGAGAGEVPLRDVERWARRLRQAAMATVTSS